MVGPTISKEIKIIYHTLLLNGAVSPEPVADVPGLFNKNVVSISSKAAEKSQTLRNSLKIGINATAISTSWRSNIQLICTGITSVYELMAINLCNATDTELNE